MGQRPISKVLNVAQQTSIGLALTGAHRRTSPAVSLRSLLRATAAAERAGLDSLWIGDHVSAPDEAWFSNIPTLAALAAHSSHLQLGAIVIAPLANPVRLANELATVDVLSRGRLAACFVAGWRRDEFAMFGVPFEERTRLTFETYGQVQTLWHGQRIVKGGVAPGCVAPQHEIDCWIGGSGQKCAVEAARRGIGYLQSSHVDLATVERRSRDYLGQLPGGYSPRLGLLRQSYVAGTDEKAWATAKPVLGDYYATYRAWGLGSEAGLAHADGVSDGGSRFVIGSPENVARQLHAVTRTTGVSHFICRMGWPGLSDEDLERSISLIGSVVLPMLRQLGQAQ